MSSNEGRVYFSLVGDDFEPGEISAFLGIKPTSTKKKGSRVPGKLPRVSSWEISTENVVNGYVDVYELSTQIIQILKPKKDEIIQAMNRFNLKPHLEVVLWFSTDEKHSTPAIGFEVETIQFLAEIGAYIDVDTYKH